MSNTKKYLTLFIILILPIVLFSQNSKGYFKDFYNFDDVYKAEVSLFKKNEYNQVDYKELLKVLQCSKNIISKFIPYKEVILYDKGGVTYTIYFSKNYRRIEITGKTFSLTKKQSKKISEIFNNKGNFSARANL